MALPLVEDPNSGGSLNDVPVRVSVSLEVCSPALDVAACCCSSSLERRCPPPPKLVLLFMLTFELYLRFDWLGFERVFKERRIVAHLVLLVLMVGMLRFSIC